MKISELVRKLEENELDAYIGVKNARYLSETPASRAAIITPGDSILLCSRLNRDRAERESKIPDIRTFSKSKVPLREGETAIFGELGEVIAEIIKEGGAERVGYDQLDSRTLQELQDNSEAEYEEASDLLRDLRMIKTDEEINYLKKAASLAIKGIEKAEELIEPGRTEIEIAAEVEYEMRKSGSEGTAFNTIVASGNNSWLPEAGATQKRLKRGEIVIVDLGATYRGYTSDMARTFALRPTRKQKILIEVAKRAQRIALSRIKDGVEAAKVDGTARTVFRRAGYERFCLHGSGHGIGVDLHEPPSLSVKSEDTLRREMVITVEPGVYVQGVGGARFEDMIVVTESGHKLLTAV